MQFNTTNILNGDSDQKLIRGPFSPKLQIITYSVWRFTAYLALLAQVLIKKKPVLGKQTFVSHLQSGLGKEMLKFCPWIPDLIAVLEQESWTHWLPEVPSNLKYFVIKVTCSMDYIINNGHYFFRFLWQNKHLQNKHLSPEGLNGRSGPWPCWAGPKCGWGRSLKEQM